MSNLLNNKKKLLNRGAAIVPEQQFDLDTIIKEEEPVKTVKENKPKESKPKARKPRARKSKETIVPTEKNKSEVSNTSLRVSKQTRNRLKALIQYGKADNMDLLIDILLNEYLETHFTEEEKKTYDLILKIMENRGK